MSNYYLNHTGAQLDEAIQKVRNGFRDVSLVTATETDVAVGKKIVDKNGNVVSGAMPQVDIATPIISVGANGLITVTLTQNAGQIASGTKTVTYQLPTHSGGQYDANSQTINVSGKFMTGDIVIVKREPTYTVTSISGASYGFSLNSSGYYESTNKGVNNSYSLCRVNFNIPSSTTVYFDCINYAESNYDYGLIGKLDTALGLNASADSSVTKNFKGSSSASVQTVSMSISAGTHYVDVKFIKDSSQADNNDSLQFKIRFA